MWKQDNKGVADMKKATIQLGTLTCPSCMLKIEAAAKALAGVQKESVKVMFNSSKVKLEFDEQLMTIQDAEQAITTLGYEVKKSQVSEA
jgi:copper chaperone CopZ